MNKNLKTSSIVISLAIVTLASGCAATKEIEQKVGDRHKETSVMFDNAYEKKPEYNKLVNKEKGFWVNPNPITVYDYNTRDKNLPAMFQRNVEITMAGKSTLTEVLSEITNASASSKSGILNFVISPDVYDAGSGLAQIITSDGAGSGAAPAASNNSNKQVFVYNFSYKGNISSALDVLTTKTDLSWKWENGKVHIFKYETKTYNISALSGVLSNNANISSGSTSTGDGSGNTGDSKQNVEMKATISTWNEVSNFLRSMLSPNARISLMESTGLVSIRDTPANLAVVDRAIKDLNKILGKQIAINVAVYSVTMNKGDNYGMDWNAAWTNLSSGLNLTYSTLSDGLPINAIAGGTGMGAGILKDNGSNKVDISSMLSALSKMGQASMMYNSSLYTLNGQPVPTLVARETTYLKEVKVSSNSDGGSTSTELTPGTVNSGIGLNITPKIQPNGSVLLQYSIDLSELEEIKEFSSGSSKIQMPTRTVRNILQRASLRSGETLVVSGFRQMFDSVDRNGVGSPKAWAAGGKLNSSSQDTQLVITLTPYIVK